MGSGLLNVKSRLLFNTVSIKHIQFNHLFVLESIKQFKRDHVFELTTKNKNALSKNKKVLYSINFFFVLPKASKNLPVKKCELSLHRFDNVPNSFDSSLTLRSLFFQDLIHSRGFIYSLYVDDFLNCSSG